MLTHQGDFFCFSEYTGIVADIVFILDDSSAVTTDFFMLEIKFVQRLTRMFDIGPDAVRVAVVSYNDNSNVRLLLF